MCGLAGAISLSKTVGLFTEEVDKFKQLAIISQLRGPHSTGILSMSKVPHKVKESKANKIVYTAKDLGNSSNFLESDNGREIVHRPDTLFLAVHCRYATVGDITVQNAHPFKCGDIYGMHNGTISNLNYGGKTDSENLLILMNEKGPARALKDYIRGGAYALVYVDLKEQTLNIIRNVQRSLYYMEHNQVLYYASEYEMLNLLRSREGMGVTNSIRLFETETFYKFSLKDLSDRTTEKLYTPVSVPIVSYYPSEEKKEKESFSLPKNLGSESSKKDATPKGTYHAFRNKRLELNAAIQQLNKGCCLCKKKVKLNEKAYWFNNYSWLCQVCKEDPIAESYIDKGSIYESRFVTTEEGGNGTSKEDKEGGDHVSVH